MRQWTVDAFAPARFKGNPACVVAPFDVWPDVAWMQTLAMENNQAETAFLLKTADPARFGLRWFTPAIEVPLCGHATLASTHVLFAELGVKADEITFDTRSGALTVKQVAGGYEMDFPAARTAPIAIPDGLAEALGVEPREVLVSRWLLAVLDSETQVRNLKPDIPALHRISGGAHDGPGNILVTALADENSPYDLVSRFFAPGSGIPEDPATGAAHCVLTPLFAERLGKKILKCHQAYPGRGGDLTCEARGDRVGLTGAATTVLESVIRD